MIRKTIIVILILATIATASAWIASCVVPYNEAARYGLDMHGFVLQYRYRGACIGCVFQEGKINVLAATLIKPADQVQNRHYYLGPFTFMIFSETFQPEGRCRIWSIDMPFWFPLGLLAAYPAFTLIRGPLRRRYRRRNGRCPNCSYNLTGNITGICPECGKNVISQIAAPGTDDDQPAKRATQR